MTWGQLTRTAARPAAIVAVRRRISSSVVRREGAELVVGHVQRLVDQAPQMAVAQ